MSNDNERTDDHSDELDDQRGRGSGFPRWLKWGLLGALTILIVVYGAVLIYVNFINDSPDELDESDLDAALAIDGTAPDSESSSDPTTAPTTPQDETVDPTDTAPVDTTPVETIPPSETTEAPPSGTSATSG